MNLNKSRNFSKLELGNLENIGKHSFGIPVMPKPLEGKKFLKEDLALTSMEVSINKMEPGTGMPFYHQHTENEELYIFIKGQGEFQIDDETFPVREGTAIRIAPNGVRIWRNNSTEALYYIVIQAKAESIGGSAIVDGKMVKKEVSW